MLQIIFKELQPLTPKKLYQLETMMEDQEDQEDQEDEDGWEGEFDEESGDGWRKVFWIVFFFFFCPLKRD